LVLLGREALAVGALLEIGDSILAIGYVLGEKVVKVVVDERVVDAAGVA